MKSIKYKFFIVTFCSLIFAILSTSLPAWPVVNGVAISTAVNFQLYPQILSDDAGGAIITWQDNRNGNNDIYTQRVNSVGSTLWTLGGVALSTAVNSQSYPQIISDGAGGAIITWQDNRSGLNNTYAQRIDSVGSTLWTLNGVVLCTSNGQYYPQIVSAGAGGAIIAWQDGRSGNNYDIYAQRVNSSGSPFWTLDGVAVCTAVNDQYYPKMASDGGGGAIITWYDYRSGNNYDIYARRVNSVGSTLWTQNGVALCTAVGVQNLPQIVSDGSGGAIITWQDERNGIDNDIYIQRVNSVGSTLWALDGMALCTTINGQYYPQFVSDGSGGVIITWEDQRSSGIDDIYAQRVNSVGSTIWTLDGVAVCTAVNGQFIPQIVSDGSGGAIITWYDYRSGNNYDIYARRVNSVGSTLWTLDGVAVCTAVNGQFTPQIISDGSGGAIITWQDGRSGNDDIYAQQINPQGQVPIIDWMYYSDDLKSTSISHLK